MGCRYVSELRIFRVRFQFSNGDLISPGSSVVVVGLRRKMTKNSFTSAQFRFCNQINFLKKLSKRKGRERERDKEKERIQFSDLMGFQVKICDL